MVNPNPTVPEPGPKQPAQPDQQNAQPNKPEINPAQPGNNTEVDLDKQKTQTYPDKTPPERH